MKLEGLSLIGADRATPSGPSSRPVNPATGEPLGGDFFTASPEDIEKAAQLADAASAVFGRWSAKQKAALLRRIAGLIEADSAAILERANLETALPAARLQGEMGRTCGQLRLFATLVEDGWWLDARIDRADPDRKPLSKPDVRSMLAPLGPVAVFGASNFPLAFSVAGGDTASALAAGCPVIVKTHPGHPGTSELVGLAVQQAVQECGAPEGTFSMLHGGAGHETGVALVKHPLIRAVGFTGSRRGGRALMDIAAARSEPIPVYAEMGSVNPVFILPGALAQRAEAIAVGLHASVTMSVGQFCTSPGLAFVGADQAGPFVEKLGSLIAATPAGTMLTADILSGFRTGTGNFTQTPGVQKLAQAPAGDAQSGATLFQTDAATFLGQPGLMDEVFGPSTLVVACGSREDLLAAARQLEGQLTATIHGTPEDLAAHRDLLSILETKAGRLIFNGFPTDVEVCHAMNHGGPYPATGDGRSTSVGTRAITRFARPVCYQDFPEDVLPDELKDANPLGIRRLVDGKFEPK